jgi:hypothetical protein
MAVNGEVVLKLQDFQSRWLCTPHTRVKTRIDRISASFDRKIRYSVVGDNPGVVVLVGISRVVNGEVVLKLQGFPGSRLLHTTHKGENLK